MEMFPVCDPVFSNYELTDDFACVYEFDLLYTETGTIAIWIEENGFSKKQHLQQNIDALQIAFKLEKEKRQATVGERLLMCNTADLAVLNSR